MAANPAAEFVSEGGVLRIQKSTVAEIRAVVGSITRQFETARRYNNYDGGERVYFNYQPAGYSDSYRTEIIDASITPQVGVTDTSIWEATGTKTVSFDINWTRRNYFEGPEAILTVYNGNGTSGTVGFDPHFNDGSGATPNKKYNYVSISGTSIQGDLPCATKFVITASNERLKRFGIWAGWDASITATSFTDYSGSAASAGECNGTAYAALATTQVFTPGSTSTYAGYPFEMVARVRHHTSASATVALWASQTTGYTVTTDKVYTTVGTSYWSIVPVGIMTIPDKYISDPVVAAPSIRFYCDGTIDWDCSWLVPVSAKIVAEAEQASLIFNIDGIDGQNYGRVSSAVSAYLETYGEMKLFPGKDTRLHFLNSNNVAVSTSNTYTVTVSYRPRRLTI